MITIILICTITSIVGGLASLSFTSKGISIFDMMLAIVLGNIVGLILNHFLENAIELIIASSAFIALFSVDITNELREIIGKSSNTFNKIIDKELENKEDNKDD